MKHLINNEILTVDIVKNIVKHKQTLELSKESAAKINQCRHYLNQKMINNKEPIYGVTTGFGALYNIAIDNDKLSQLQKNLIISHACGIGDEVPKSIVKLMLLLKIQSLSYGHSGVQLETVQRLIDYYNNDILPVVYQQGSLGASGDLVPLAHLCLPLLGLGSINYNNKIQPAAEINQQFGWQPITLQAKEGLALLNGTQFMSAYALYNIINAEHLSETADRVMCISLDAFDGRIEPFMDAVHKIRPHRGQIDTANFIRQTIDGSQIIQQKKDHIQDPYSFRCVPQVHGATKDTINYVKQVITTEINSATDNPNIFPDLDIIISAGNFHGQPLALALDFLAIAIAELGNISERRIYQLISGKRNLPNFLIANSGLNSGFMIPQYTAASIVSQNKQLCSPASIDSIESSQGQEDHVSMGANAATKCYKVLQNTERIIAIELFNAAQALDFRTKLTNKQTSPSNKDLLDAYRCVVNFVEDDEVMFEKIHKSIKFIQSLN
ncbi:MAG: histidine ammonia-lyase [Bacteroidetes bacterium]|nr:histidine ammonia-lyase [Bacteroidota bacterium]